MINQGREGTVYMRAGSRSERKIQTQNDAFPSVQIAMLHRIDEWSQLGDAERNEADLVLQQGLSRVDSVLNFGGAITANGDMIMPSIDLDTAQPDIANTIRRYGVLNVSGTVARKGFGLPEFVQTVDGIEVSMHPSSRIVFIAPGIVDRIIYQEGRRGRGFFYIDDSTKYSSNMYKLQDTLEAYLKKQLAKNKTTYEHLAAGSLVRGLLREAVSKRSTTNKPEIL